MKKRTFALVLSLLMIAALFSGCAAKSMSMESADMITYTTGSTTSAVAPSSPQVSVSESYYNGSYKDIAADYDSGAVNDAMSSVDEGASASADVPREEGRKRIFYGSMEIETLDFDQSVANLNAIVTQLGGYFDSTDLKGGSLYDYGYSRRHATYTVKVPSRYFDVFMGNAGQVGNVLTTSTWSDDITMEYYDLQTRLETLNAKKDRLLDLLKKADVMADIIELENALSETTYEIESLTTTLQRYDNLVDYSTVTINISEVIKETTVRETPRTLGERISAEFGETCEELVNFFENFAVWFIGGIPAIALLLVIVLIFWLIIRLVIRRIRKRLSRHAAAPQAAPPEQNTERTE